MGKSIRSVRKSGAKSIHLRAHVDVPEAKVPVARERGGAGRVVTTRKRNGKALLRVPREVRNGVRRPKKGGVCAAVWSWLDRNGNHRLAEMKDVMAAKGWNRNNVAAELTGWRKFKGVTRVRAK